MTDVRIMQYTKNSGDRSLRHVLVVSQPRKNYLVYDVTKLKINEIEALKTCIEESDKFRESAMKDFEILTGIKQRSLWRSFKPEGIEWESDNEI